MKDLFASLLAILSTWPQPKPPAGELGETPAEYEERRETIVGATTQAAREGKGWSLEVRAAGVIVVWDAEHPGFDRYIHAGLPHPDPRNHQDHGHAICLGSIHRNNWWTVEQWKSFAGTSFAATLRCARATLRLLRSQWWICGKGRGDLETELAWTLQQYATGAKECAAPCDESKDRARMWVALVNRIGRVK